MSISPGGNVRAFFMGYYCYALYFMESPVRHSILLLPIEKKAVSDVILAKNDQNA